jgi:hypothetical protein
MYFDPVKYQKTLKSFRNLNESVELEEETTEEQPKSKLSEIKANLLPEEAEQLEEYLDALKEIKKSVKKLIQKGMKGKKPQEMDETGGDMMHQTKYV